MKKIVFFMSIFFMFSAHSAEKKGCPSPEWIQKYLSKEVIAKYKKSSDDMSPSHIMHEIHSAYAFYNMIMQRIKDGKSVTFFSTEGEFIQDQKEHLKAMWFRDYSQDYKSQHIINHLARIKSENPEDATIWTWQAQYKVLKQIQQDFLQQQSPKENAQSLKKPCCKKQKRRPFKDLKWI